LGLGVLGVSVDLSKQYMIDKILHYCGIMTRTQIIALLLSKAGVNQLIITAILLLV
jgi:hypothetical protein